MSREAVASGQSFPQSRTTKCKMRMKLAEGVRSTGLYGPAFGCLRPHPHFHAVHCHYVRMKDKGDRRSVAARPIAWAFVILTSLWQCLCVCFIRMAVKDWLLRNSPSVTIREHTQSERKSRFFFLFFLFSLVQIQGFVSAGPGKRKKKKKEERMTFPFPVSGPAK